MMGEIRWLRGANQLVVDVVEYEPADEESGEQERFIWRVLPVIGLRFNGSSAADVYICLHDQIQTTKCFERDYWISCNVRYDNDPFSDIERDSTEKMLKIDWRREMDKLDSQTEG